MRRGRNWDEFGEALHDAEEEGLKDVHRKNVAMEVWK